MSDMRVRSTKTLEPLLVVPPVSKRAQAASADRLQGGGTAALPVSARLTRELMVSDRHEALEAVIADAIAGGELTRDTAPFAMFAARMSLARYSLALIEAGTHDVHEVRGLAYAKTYMMVTQERIDRAVQAGQTARADIYALDAEDMRDRTQWSPFTTERAWIARTSRADVHAMVHGKDTDDSRASMAFARELHRWRDVIEDVARGVPLGCDHEVASLLAVHAIDRAQADRILAHAELNARNDQPGAWTRSPG